MDYNQPFGGSTGAPYVNGNPSAGIQGSIPPAGAIEYPQREIVHLIEKNLLTPANGDLYQLAKSIQLGRISYGVDTGSASAISVALDPVPAAYQAGLRLLVLVSNNTTGATTVNVNGLGAKALVRPGNTAIVSGDIHAGDLIDIGYDGTRFQLLSIFAGIGTGGGGALSPGVTVIQDPVTALLEQARPRGVTAAANRTFVAGDRGKLISRSNGGAAMADILPGGGSTFPNGWMTTIRNDNVANYTVSFGNLVITPSGGGTIDGASSLVVAPSASLTLVSDGTNYWTCNETVMAKVVAGTSNGNLTGATIFRCWGNIQMCAVWGAVSSLAQGVSAHVTLPITYGTASFIISTGVSGAAYSAPALTTANAGPSGFDIANVSPTPGILNAHWSTWGML